MGARASGMARGHGVLVAWAGVALIAACGEIVPIEMPAWPDAAPAGDLPGPGGICVLDDAAHAGAATSYVPAQIGACGFALPSSEALAAGLGEVDHAGAAACGACVVIDGPDGSVEARIEDLCSDCQPGDINLTTAAFERIAPLALGRVPVTWRYVACASEGPIVYHFHEDSSPWWTAVQVRDHRYPIAGLAYLAADGRYREVARTGYNYFVAPEGMGPGPYTFRVTDVAGRILEDTGIRFVAGGEVPGAGQFPACMAP